MRRAPTGRLATAASLVFVLLFSTSSFAIDLGPDQPVIAVKWGRTGRGAAEISGGLLEDREITAGSLTSLGAAFDFPLSRRLFASISVDWWLNDEGSWPALDLNLPNLEGVELSVHLKGLADFRNGRYAVRPGVGIGFFQGHYSIVTLRAGVELQASVFSRVGIGVETGVWSGPIGTESGVWQPPLENHQMDDIRIGPLGYMRVQLLFATGSRGQDN